MSEMMVAVQAVVVLLAVAGVAGVIGFMRSKKRSGGYQTRHTAAVLHLAAGENPLFVSRLLGHSSTKMLFERYAPFVANALADDGSRFERMMDGVEAR